LCGFGLLILGALIYVKFSFYLGMVSTLAQQIGVRLALTGLMISGMSGLADTPRLRLAPARERSGDLLWPDPGGERRRRVRHRLHRGADLRRQRQKSTTDNGLFR